MAESFDTDATEVIRTIQVDAATMKSSPEQAYEKRPQFLSKVLGWPIVVLGGSEMLTVLDGTVVALAIPKITTEFNISPTSASWFVTAYMLSFAGFLLLGGRLGDAFGRKKIFIIGISILISASLLTGFVSRLPVFLLCRVIQGFGAALASPTAMAYVASLYKPGAMRSQAVAIYGSMMGLGSILGLTVGGLLANFDWRWVFWINVPIGLCIIFGAWKTLPETPNDKVCLDYLGVLLVTGGSAGLIAALSFIGKVPAYSLKFWIPLTLGIGALVWFVFNERSSAQPVIPIELLKNKNRVLALIANFFSGGIMTCMAIYTAQYLQIIVKYSPQQSGLAVLPFAVGMGLAMVVSPVISQKVAPRWIIITAGVFLLGCFFYVSSLLENYPGYFPRFFIIIGIIGFGVGLVMTSIMLAVLAGVAPHDAGILSALQKVVLEIGGGVGVLLVATIQAYKIKVLGGISHSLDQLTSGEEHNLIASYSLSIICVAGIAVITGVIVFFMDFTPEEVCEGIKAKEQAESGIA